MPEHTLRLCALYPDLMNIYADRGNILLLERRCAWRGIGFTVTAAGIGDEIDPAAHDLFYIGGGQDRDQLLCARDLVEVKRDALHAAAARGAVILGVCGGYQLLGHSYVIGDEEIGGIGLLDLVTVREDGPRLIGNVAIEVDLPERRPRRSRASSRASRTTAAAPASGRRVGRSAASCAGTGTTAPRGSRAAATATSSGPTSTVRCCRRTPGSRTGSCRRRSA